MLKYDCCFLCSRLLSTKDFLMLLDSSPHTQRQSEVLNEMLELNRRLLLRPVQIISTEEITSFLNCREAFYLLILHPTFASHMEIAVNSQV